MSEPVKPRRMPISVGSLLWIALIVWLVIPSPGPTERRIDGLREELAELRREVSLLRASLAKTAGEPPAPHAPVDRVDRGSGVDTRGRIDTPPAVKPPRDASEATQASTRPASPEPAKVASPEDLDVERGE
jgi:hypothetical protein